MGVQPMTYRQPNYAFASLMSATDPVATLALFAFLKLQNTQPMLAALVFGESVINDAVAIVLFNIVNAVGSASVSEVFADLMWLFFGSILAGIVIAAACVLLFKLAGLDGEQHTEVTYIALVPYLVYACAYSVGLSGIIACLFAGIIFQLYGSQHLSEHGMSHTDTFMEFLARFGESIIFLICGCTVAFFKTEFIKFSCIAVALVLVSRMIVVKVCSGIANAVKEWVASGDDEIITWQHQVVMCVAGLRGGIPILLSLSVNEDWCDPTIKIQIISATFFTVCVILTVAGCGTLPTLQVLGLVDADTAAGSHLGDEAREEHLAMRVPSSTSHADLSRKIASTSTCLSGVHGAVQRVLGKDTQKTEPGS
jgi:NhaP-type Na+/H+ or K+/H+ antiporter